MPSGVHPHEAVIAANAILAEAMFQLALVLIAQYLAHWTYTKKVDKYDRNDRIEDKQKPGRRITKVPVESVEKTALWLRGHGFDKVGLWGISMGAELALLAGSLMPELISCVTAVCPTNICGQGFVKKKGIQQLECSAFSWRGEELPWARLKASKAVILRDSLRERSICLRSCYEDAVLNAPEEAQIKVENISGPVLLLYPQYDAMWPSELSVEKIRVRLKEKNFPHPCKCVSYKYASHMLVPVKSRSTIMFQVERKYPQQCWESDMDAFEKTLAFWKEVW